MKNIIKILLAINIILMNYTYSKFYGKKYNEGLNVTEEIMNILKKISKSKYGNNEDVSFLMSLYTQNNFHGIFSHSLFTDIFEERNIDSNIDRINIFRNAAKSILNELLSEEQQQEFLIKNIKYHIEKKIDKFLKLKIKEINHLEKLEMCNEMHQDIATECLNIFDTLQK